MDQKAEILIKYYRENKSQRAISREMKIFRTTVRKYIKKYKSKCEKIFELQKNVDGDKSDMLALVDELSSSPTYDTGNRKKTKLTTEITGKIEDLLMQNEENKFLGRSKQLMKKIDIHEKLVDMGYDISYSTVCIYIRENYEVKKAFFS